MPGQQPPPGAQPQAVAVPAEIVRAIQMKTIGMLANAVVSGDYDGAEVIPDAHKKLIGDMLLTLAQNAALETAKCEHCREIRLEHELSLEDGDRYCKDEHQPKPTEDDPTLIPPKNKYRPELPSQIAVPGGQRTEGGIILPGRG